MREERWEKKAKEGSLTRVVARAKNLFKWWGHKTTEVE